MKTFKDGALGSMNKKIDQTITNNYKELYISLMLSTIKDQLAGLKANGCSVGILKNLTRATEKFLSYTASNVRSAEKITTNLEILKRTVNSLRNICVELEKTRATHCNIRTIKRLLVKNFRIFFPCNLRTRSLFQTAHSEHNIWQIFFSRLTKIPTLKFLGKLANNALKPASKSLDDSDETLGDSNN
jgi:hypothetical protein